MVKKKCFFVLILKLENNAKKKKKSGIKNMFAITVQFSINNFVVTWKHSMTLGSLKIANIFNNC